MPATWAIRRPISSAIPVRARPSLMMNIAQTVITVGLENPANAYTGVTRPLSASADSNQQRPTRSIRIHSVTKRTSATSRIARTNAIARFIAASKRPDDQQQRNTDRHDQNLDR